MHRRQHLLVAVVTWVFSFIMAVSVDIEDLGSFETAPSSLVLILVAASLCSLSFSLVFFEQFSRHEPIQLPLVSRTALSIAATLVIVIIYSSVDYIFNAPRLLLFFICLISIIAFISRYSLRPEFKARSEPLSKILNPLTISLLALLAIYLLCSHTLPSDSQPWYASQDRGPILIALLFVFLISASIAFSNFMAPRMGSKRLFLVSLLTIFFGFLAIHTPVWWTDYKKGVSKTTEELREYQTEMYHQLDAVHQRLRDIEAATQADGERTHELDLTIPDEYFSGQQDDVFDMIGLTVGVVAIGLAAWGLWFQSKMDSLTALDERVEDLNGLVVMAAETALSSMPDFSKTQQIPDNVAPTLTTLHRILFEDEEQRVRAYLKRTGNGLMLHYAHSLYHFCNADFAASSHFLKKEVISKGVTGRMWIDSHYRLGICQRQQQQWSKSISTFQRLQRSGHARAQELGRLGTVISLLAWQPNDGNPAWDRSLASLAEDIGLSAEASYSPARRYEAIGFGIASQLHEQVSNSTMATSYALKFLFLVFSQYNVGSMEALKIAMDHDPSPSEGVQHLQSAVETFADWPLRTIIANLQRDVQLNSGGLDNISVNYGMVDAWCDWMEAAVIVGEGETNIDDVKDKLESACRKYDRVARLAEQYAQRAVESSFSDLIYSEFVEREVQPTQIADEARRACRFIQQLRSTVDRSRIIASMNYLSVLEQ